MGTTLKNKRTKDASDRGRRSYGHDEQKRKRREHSPEVTVLVDESSELLEDLRVHGVRHHVGVGDGLSVLLSEIGLDLLEVERSHGESRSLVDGSSISARRGRNERFDASVKEERNEQNDGGWEGREDDEPDDLAPQRLRESTVRLSEVTLEELDDGLGEIELVGSVDDVLLRELVRDHELGEVSYDLRRGSDLDDVSTLKTSRKKRKVSANRRLTSTRRTKTHELVGLDVLLLDLGPLGSESELRSLELKVGVLSEGRRRREN